MFHHIARQARPVGPRRPGVLASVCLLLLIPTHLPIAADEWESTRQRLIDPLNSMLHRHWPGHLEARDLDVLLRFYAVDEGTGLTWGGGEATRRWTQRGAEPIRVRYQRLLDLFEEIHHAEQRVERVDWKNPGPLGHPTRVHAIIRGTSPGGGLIQLEQWANLHVRFFDPFWEITAEEVTRRTLVSLETPRFASVATEAGITSVHENRLSPPYRLFGQGADNPVRQPSGVAVGDADRDGCEDVVLAGSPELVLYRSLCDGRFEDATAESGLPRPYPAAASGVVFFDYDNDGWPDLYVAAVSGGDRLFRNQGGRFVDVTELAEIPAGTWGSMPVIADYDRDGLLDVYIARMGDHEKRSPQPPWDATNGTRGSLLRNLGDGRFTDVSAQAQVDSPGWDMAAAWGDYDVDGWPDLYVANEFGNNRLYRNEGDGTFSDRTLEAGVADGGSAMGVTWGDIDGDGDLDLYVAGMHANSGWVLFHPDFPLPIPWYLRVLGLFTDEVDRRREIYTDRLSRGSTLFRNDGDGTFSDVSDDAGVRDAQWGWAVEFLDYDNDGLLDIYGVNGFITGPLEDDV
jgi:hypothetical protein